MDDISKMLDKQFFTLATGEIYEDIMQDIEKILIERALERTCGNKLRAARFLGLNRNTLHSKVKKLHIDVGRFKR